MKIKVIGIGGAGCNTISRLNRNSLKGVELFSANTDAQSLKKTSSPNKILIGQKTTGGLGAGMNCKTGLKAALENKETLKEILEGADIVFLTAGLGGGSGTPGISVLAELAQELRILTLAMVTLPFSFEGALRQRIAKHGFRELQKVVDGFLVIPNDQILKTAKKDMPVEQAFLKLDKVLVDALEGISDLLSLPGIINVDFADLEEVLRKSGQILFGRGRAQGEQRALAAATRALQSPLIDFAPKRAKGILFMVSGSDVALFEVKLVANFIKKITDVKTKIIFGVSEDKSLAKGEIKVTLIAAGVE